MELDDLKNDWESATNARNKQNVLNSKIINQVTQKKYQSKIEKIKYPEWIGAVICILGLCFIAFNFNKLDTVFLQVIGVLTILLLIVMPVLAYLSLMQFSLTENFNKSYFEIIKQFANQKILFLKYQKINAFLCYPLLVTVIILMPKLFYGKDITFSKLFWVFAFSLGYIFLIFFSKWVKKYYSSSLRQAEELLNETEA